MESAVLEYRSLNVAEPKFLLEKSLNKCLKLIFIKVMQVVIGIQEILKLTSYINGKSWIVPSKFPYSTWVCSSLDKQNY